MKRTDDIINYAGFRTSEIETAIDNAVQQILSSDTHTTIDFSGLHLNTEEQQYVADEIEKRVRESNL